MLGGLSGREAFMLAGMVVVAILFSWINYAMTKWGMDRVPNRSSLARKALMGAGAGVIVWLVTMSGAVSHEVGLSLAATAGFFAEKTISIYMNKKERSDALDAIEEAKAAQVSDDIAEETAAIIDEFVRTDRETK